MFFNNKYKNFWTWFKKESNIFYMHETIPENSLDKLHNELHKVNEFLTFEFGPKTTKREFIISADGIKEAFNDVEKLVELKPIMENWKILKFRQRKNFDNIITINNASLYPENIRYVLFPYNNRIGLILFISGFLNNEDIFKQMGYLFLDDALGEYDVEIKIDGIKFCDYNDEYFEQSLPTRILREDFDKLCNELKL